MSRGSQPSSLARIKQHLERQRRRYDIPQALHQRSPKRGTPKLSPSGTESLFYCKQPTTGSLYYPPGRALSLDSAATRPQPSLDSYSRTEWPSDRNGSTYPGFSALLITAIHLSSIFDGGRTSVIMGSAAN